MQFSNLMVIFPWYFDQFTGSPRVEGDEDEDDTDDLENEFDINARRGPHNIAEAMLSARLNIGRGSQHNVSGVTTPADLETASVASEIPLLTYGQEVYILILNYTSLWLHVLCVSLILKCRL